MTTFATLLIRSFAARTAVSGMTAGLFIALAGTAAPAWAADAAVAVKPAAKTAKKSPTAATKKSPPADLPLTAATEEQISAAGWVYYGEYECEFKQVVQIKASEQHPAYVDLQFGKSSYLMKPVLSSTGAIRLEDVKGQTLMVQIASKSMLLNVRTGSRLVDACVGESHRAAMLAAKQTVALEFATPSTLPTATAAAQPAP